MLDVLHWLPIQQRMTSKIAALVWRCLLGLASVYLGELCCPIPWVSEAVAASVQLSWVCSLSLLPVHLLGRTAPSQSLALGLERSPLGVAFVLQSPFLY